MYSLHRESCLGSWVSKVVVLKSDKCENIIVNPLVLLIYANTPPKGDETLKGGT
jgi:hypothetical protein